MANEHRTIEQRASLEHRLRVAFNDPHFDPEDAEPLLAEVAEMELVSIKSAESAESGTHSEHLSSNLLCKHRDPDGSWSTWVFEECPRCQIERLTADRDGWKAHSNRWYEDANRYQSERDRLRAALERIEVCAFKTSALHSISLEMLTIAREALAGAADEDHSDST